MGTAWSGSLKPKHHITIGGFMLIIRIVFNIETKHFNKSRNQATRS